MIETMVDSLFKYPTINVRLLDNSTWYNVNVTSLSKKYEQERREGHANNESLRR